MSIDWADMLHIVKDRNAEKNECKESDEQKGDEHDNESSIAGLVSCLGGDHVSTVWALKVGHRPLSKGSCYHCRPLLCNSNLHTHTRTHARTHHTSRARAHTHTHARTQREREDNNIRSHLRANTNDY